MEPAKRGFHYSQWTHINHDEIPRMTTALVAGLSVLYTVAYVLPLYIFARTRPSPVIHRDSPTVIKGRILVVSIACLICSLRTIVLFTYSARMTRSEMFHLLGWYPLQPDDVVKALLLTMLLFLGPLFERVIVEGGWKRYATGKPLQETLSTWTGWRNFVAGPITEEVMFRSLLTSITLLSSYTTKQTILITPLYFGVAHIHHFYESRLMYPQVPIAGTLFTSLFQFTYTTLFGWYANFVFVRTGSLYSIILIHSFCNWMGFPRLWGRVEPEVVLAPVQQATVDTKRGPAYRPPYQKREPSVLWTVAYYVLLVAGVIGFKSNLWPLTASSNALGVI